MTDNLTDQLFSSETEEEISSDIFADEPAPSLYKEDKYGPPAKTRESGEKIIGTIIFGVGSLLVGKQIDPPVGRCLQFESPLAAKQIDVAIAGTFIDRLLQPLFRKSEQLEGLGAVIALPVLVGLYERKPNLAPAIEPVLYEVVATTMEQVAPLMRKERTKQRRTARTLADLNETFNLPPDVKDPVEAVLSGYIFQDFQGAEETNEAEG